MQQLGATEDHRTAGLSSNFTVQMCVYVVK